MARIFNKADSSCTSVVARCTDSYDSHERSAVGIQPAVVLFFIPNCVTVSKRQKLIRGWERSVWINPSLFEIESK